MRGLIAALGAPDEISQRVLLTRRARAEILAWLRPVETLLRRLLLIEAAALACELAPARAHKRTKPRERPRQLVAQDLLQSADWPVSFRMLAAFPEKVRAESIYAAVWARVDAGEVLYLVLQSLSPEERARYGAACARPKLIAGDPWPLAERAEAVARVLADPLPFAKRLARRLTARPERVRAFYARDDCGVRRRPAGLEAGLDAPLRADARLFVEAQEAAAAAIRAFDTS